MQLFADLTPTLSEAGWAAFALAVLGWIAQNVIPYLRDRKQMALADEDRLIQPYKDQIAALQIASDRHDKEVAALRVEHQECVKNTGILTGKLEVLQARDEMKRKEIAELREEVNRLTRHEANNIAHVEELHRHEAEEKRRKDQGE